MTDFSKDIEQALEILKRGGIILYPTDTIWGLGCDATNAAAVDRIYTLKRRPTSKSMIVLVAEERDVLQYVAGLDMQIFEYLEKTERPTTVIYEGAIGLADNVVNEDGSVAIRIVKDEFCRHLVKRFRKPIVSTSANISGQSSSGLYKDIPEEIKNEVDYQVKYRQQEETPGQPSSIITWKSGIVNVLR